MDKNDNKVNIKARVDRHLRIVRKTGVINSKVLNDKKWSHSLSFVVLFLVFIFPIYPSLASFVYNNSNYDFYRGYIDESSIIEAYYGGDLASGAGSYGIPIIDSEDSFLSVNTILNDSRDLDGSNEIIAYEVREGESLSKIASSFNVSVNSILWANNFSSSYVLKPGEVIKIPPVSGVLHQVVRGDTISSIAQKYDIGESVIRTQNGIGEGDIIRVGQIIVVPGAVKQIVNIPTNTPTGISGGYTGGGNSGGGYSFASDANSQMTNETGSYRLVRRKPLHSFAWGNCTRYVSQYKDVNWGGNANQWMRNAAAKGHATGSAPSVGAIIQFAGAGYNPRYGHVGIVMEVNSDHLIISDMNYRRLNEITYRKVPISDRSIVGYIYVN